MLRQDMKDEVLLLAGCWRSSLADFASFVSRRQSGKVFVVSASTLGNHLPESVEIISPDRLSQVEFQSASQGTRLESVVLFLGSQLTNQDRSLLNVLAQAMARTKARQLVIISTYRVHMVDRSATRLESEVVAHFQNLPLRKVIFRPGQVLCPASPATAFLRRWAFCWPLIPGELSGCFVTGDELFTAVEQELSHPTAASKNFALPGPRTAWREILRRHCSPNPLLILFTLILFVPALLGIGHLLYFLATRVASLVRRPWLCDPGTLFPKSTRELLTLYNKYSYRHLKIVGYNNGVVHFGHQYPGKTLVSTVYCNRVAWIKGSHVKLDAGTTLRKCVDALAQADKELYVVPNYSYVSVGTSFFVPIHGSAK